jgi:hypothetical protein
MNLTTLSDSAVIANAREHLRRCRLTGIPCNTRTQATAILLGITPAPSRNEPSGIKPAPPTQASRCRTCGQPIRFGEPCNDFTGDHISCPLFAAAMHAISSRC